MNITDPIRRLAEATPDAVACVSDQRPDISYGDLDAMIDAIARRALDLGVRPGDRVAIDSMIGEFPFLAVALAIARIGALSFHPGAPDERIDAAIALPGRGSDVRAPRLDVEAGWFLAPPRGGRPPPLPAHQDGASIFRIFQTSGTTGTPKQVAMSHDLIARRVASRIRSLTLPKPLRTMSKIRTVATYGFMTCLRTLWEGGTIVEPPRRGDDADAIGDAIARHRVTNFVVPPGILGPMVLAMREGLGPFPSLDVVEVSGSRLTDQLARLAIERVSPNLLSMYGSTETGVTSVAPIRDVMGRPGAVGRIVPGMEVQAVDDTGAPLPPDAEGILRFRSEICVTSYADETGPSHAFRDGWFHSRDVGYVATDGMLVIGGRLDERLNVGGAKISPETLEQRVLELPDILDVAAFAYPTSLGVDRVGIAIVVRPSFDFDRFKAQCTKKLGVFAPGIVLRVDAIPRNEVGKTSRARLAALVPASAREVSRGRTVDTRAPGAKPR